MSGPADAWFETISGERLLVGASCALGRDPENQIVLRDEEVSRRHALVHRQNHGQYWLVDLGSLNGTYRNGMRVRQPMRLQSGDRIELGGEQLRFVAESESGADNTAASSQRLAETMATVRTAQAWLLIVDLIGFSRLSQTMPSAELATQVGSWMLQCSDLVEKNGGGIDKYLGDGLFAYWLEATGDLRFAEAVKAVLQLQKTNGLRFRWIAHFGAVGFSRSKFGDEALIGPEIVFAFRMEHLASSLRLPRLLSQQAAKGLPTIVGLHSIGTHRLQGFDDPFEFFTL
jgi:adenylate cyclase